MAPFGLMTAGFSLLAKSFGVFSCTNTLARCTSVLPAVKSLSTWKSGPPKRPMNSFMSYAKQQRPLIMRQNPGVRQVEVVSQISKQWRIMTQEQKKPFMEASAVAREQFNVALQRFQAQLSPVQSALLAEERRLILARRKSIRKKKELNSLGKPKRCRSAFNIYMAENYEQAQGMDIQAKMKSLNDNWRNLLTYERKTYMQLAEDDKVRYDNEMKTWEDHMLEIGREDLVRLKTRSRIAKKTTAAKKAEPKGKAVKKKAAGKSKKTVTHTKRA